LLKGVHILEEQTIKNKSFENNMGVLKTEGVYGRKIDGGAALLFDMPLNNTKILRKISIETVANDVIIGLMSVTLQR